LEERVQRVMPGFMDVLRGAAVVVKIGGGDVLAMCEGAGLGEVCAVVRRIAAKIKTTSNSGSFSSGRCG